MTEILDIVNEHDEVTGQIERDDPQAAGLIFRKAAILFYLPTKQIIMQKRGAQKKVNPGKYTATVIGHVSSGQTYDDTAAREALEETGIAIDPRKLVHLGVHLMGTSMRAVYAYPFDGSVNDLKIEAGEGAGFKAVTISDLRSDMAQNPGNYTSFIHDPAFTQLLDYIENA
jgi:8-oxo-dGTP pyrophosphatase MutT (NUDIX family)